MSLGCIPRSPSPRPISWCARGPRGAILLIATGLLVALAVIEFLARPGTSTTDARSG
ncbi:hypothetical protein [Pseudonocardia acaciae]|uniref:hypothetical protein n=1 Tax=Pseudonocardia acaciae TaxID=551276 RepID=UPI000A666DC9|nr:hypothetical protein [Pseudonocardia acaciae]